MRDKPQIASKCGTKHGRLLMLAINTPWAKNCTWKKKKQKTYINVYCNILSSSCHLKFVIIIYWICTCICHVVYALSSSAIITPFYFIRYSRITLWNNTATNNSECYITSACMCSMQSGNLCNLQIVLHNLGIVACSADHATVNNQSAECATVATCSADIVQLVANLQIRQTVGTWSVDCATVATQSADRATVATLSADPWLFGKGLFRSSLLLFRSDYSICRSGDSVNISPDQAMVTMQSTGCVVWTEVG